MKNLNLNFDEAKWVMALNKGTNETSMYVDLGNYLINHKASVFGDQVKIKLTPKSKVQITQVDQPLKDKSKLYLQKVIEKGLYSLNEIRPQVDNDIRLLFKKLIISIFEEAENNNNTKLLKKLVEYGFVSKLWNTFDHSGFKYKVSKYFFSEDFNDQELLNFYNKLKELKQQYPNVRP